MGLVVPTAGTINRLYNRRQCGRRVTFAQCVHHLQVSRKRQSRFRLSSFSVFELLQDLCDVFGVDEGREVDILASQDTSNHLVTQVEAVPDTSVVEAGVKLSRVPGGLNVVGRIEACDVAVGSKVVELVKTSAQCLEAKWKLRAIGRCELFGCRDFGRGPRLHGHSKRPVLLVVDAIVVGQREELGVDAALDEVLNAQRSRSDGGREAVSVRSEDASDVRAARLSKSE